MYVKCVFTPQAHVGKAARLKVEFSRGLHMCSCISPQGRIRYPHWALIDYPRSRTTSHGAVLLQLTIPSPMQIILTPILGYLLSKIFAVCLLDG